MEMSGSKASHLRGCFETEACRGGGMGVYEDVWEVLSYLTSLIWSPNIAKVISIHKGVFSPRRYWNNHSVRSYKYTANLHIFYK